MNNSGLFHGDGEKSGMILGNDFKVHDITAIDGTSHYRVYDLHYRSETGVISNFYEKIILEFYQDKVIQSVKYISYQSQNEMDLGIPDSYCVFKSKSSVKIN